MLFRSVAASREGNALKREELGIKIAQMKSDRDKATNERAAEAMGAFTTVNETDSLLTDILAKDNRGPLESALGASGWMGWVPGTDARTVTGKIERLSNILASANLDQLKGAMSDKDIMFLKNIGANLDRFQDEKKAISELERVQRKAQQDHDKALRDFKKIFKGTNEKIAKSRDIGMVNAARGVLARYGLAPPQADGAPMGMVGRAALPPPPAASAIPTSASRNWRRSPRNRRPPSRA